MFCMTNEPRRGQFLLVAKFPLEHITRVGVAFRKEFASYNLYENASRSFYKKAVVDLIKPFLQKLSIDVTFLTPQEISTLDEFVYQKMKRTDGLYYDNIVIDGDKCLGCGVREFGYLRCGGCQTVPIYYCNKECQREDWKNHKNQCESRM